MNGSFAVFVIGLAIMAISTNRLFILIGMVIGLFGTYMIGYPDEQVSRSVRAFFGG